MPHWPQRTNDWLKITKPGAGAEATKKRNRQFNQHKATQMMFEHFGLMAEGMKATVIVMMVGSFVIGIALGSVLTAFNLVLNLVREKRAAKRRASDVL
jgi:hypothetical protein